MMTLLLWILLLALAVVVGRIWLKVFPPKAAKQTEIDEMTRRIKELSEKAADKAVQAYKRSIGQ